MTSANHTAKVHAIATQLGQLKDSEKPIKFLHGSSNSTRSQVQDDRFEYLDISQLNSIPEISQERMTATVEPGVSMKNLLKATLKHGLIPKVVPEFPKITVGGAIQGASLESSSFKYGQVSDTVREMEVLLADGTQLHASPKENSDLFYGVSGSYGTLGLIVSAEIELISALPFVKLELTKVNSAHSAMLLIDRIRKIGAADFIEEIVFDQDEIIVASATMISDIVGHELSHFSHKTSEWYYKTIEQINDNSQLTHTLFMTLEDYLFRYDYGAFWMGDYFFQLFGIPNNRLTRTLYHAFMRTGVLYQGLKNTNIADDYFIQDYYIPITKLEKMLNFIDAKLDIKPLWLCPILNTKTQQLFSPHYHDECLIDVGVYGDFKVGNLDARKALTLEIDQFVYDELNGRKMLYADCFWSEQQFWGYYDQKAYLQLKSRYDPQHKFSTVWHKTYSAHFGGEERLVAGTFKTFIQTLRGEIL